MYVGAWRAIELSGCGFEGMLEEEIEGGVFFGYV